MSVREILRRTWHPSQAGQTSSKFCGEGFDENQFLQIEMARARRHKVRLIRPSSARFTSDAVMS